MTTSTVKLTVKRTAACAAVLLLVGCAQRPSESVSQLDQGALLASTCSGCHVADDSSKAIAGFGEKSADELLALLLAYKLDGPSSMHRMARGYSDEELRLIARHLAAGARLSP